MMPSVTFLRLSDVSVICRVTYFQFTIQSAFLPYRSTDMVYPILDIERAENLGSTLLVHRVHPRGMILNYYSNGKNGN